MSTDYYHLVGHHGYIIGLDYLDLTFGQLTIDDPRAMAAIFQ
jgi:hypothetical protein